MPVKQITACLCLVLFFVLTPSTYAQTLNLNQPLTYAGLTFNQPLTFSTPQKSLPTRSLSFATQTSNTPKTYPTLTMHMPAITMPVEKKILPATPTPSPTETPTPTPTETPTPIQIPSPTPTATPSPTTIPTPISLSSPNGLNADKLFDMVNSYRASKGLPAFQKDDKSCQLAASRAPEVATEVATGTMHQGLRNRNLPYWNTENIISYNSEEGALSWWLNDQIHKEAIESNNTYSCLACSGNSCAEEFTNYQAK